MTCPDWADLVAFISRAPDEPSLRHLEDHLDRCAHCSDLVGRFVQSEAEATRAPDSELAIGPGQQIGRFLVLHEVGQGGMGQVFAAYDADLDRRVAIKVLRPHLAYSAQSRARLFREAQAIARLSHPNVVVVYEVGTVRDTVFVAMEFVEGRTLGAWLDDETRPWPEILRTFIEAGRGLAAAHEAGIVHRDFKPDNVMISAGGQIRVMDFGIARWALLGDRSGAGRQGPSLRATLDPNVETVQLTAKSPMPAPAVPAPGSRGFSCASDLGGTLTKTGALLGTPAYMAPEQLLGAGTDDRTDQFSFCIALYEGLYGERPFAGDTIAELTDHKLRSNVRPAPKRSRVPVWLRRHLLRGLSPDPSARFPSMEALLRALGRNPLVLRNRIVSVAAAAMLIAGGGGVTHQLSTRKRIVCDEGGARLVGIWELPGRSSARRNALHHAFLERGKSSANASFVTTARLLDNYVAGWSRVYRDSCEATHVRGDQSEQVMDLRMSCLEERLTNVRALTDLLMSPDAHDIDNAPSAAGALPDLGVCSNIAALRAVVKPPDVATSRQVAKLREDLARFGALRDAGRCEEARQRADPLIASVRATGYLPLLADVLNAAALLLKDCDEPVVAVSRLEEAYLVANASHHDQAGAEAAVCLAAAIADRLGQPLAGREWLTVGEGAVRRLSGDNARIRVWLAQSRCAVAVVARDRARAVLDCDNAFTVSTKTLGSDHPDTLVVAISLAGALDNAGRHEEALSFSRSTIARAEQVFGASHPIVGLLNSNTGEILNSLRRYDEAIVHFRRALAVWTDSRADRLRISYALTGLGQSWLGLGVSANAVAPLEQALEIRTSRTTPLAAVAETRFALARALWSSWQDRAGALVLGERARVDLSKADESDGLAEVEAWLMMARAERRRAPPSITPTTGFGPTR